MTNHAANRQRNEFENQLTLHIRAALRWFCLSEIAKRTSTSCYGSDMWREHYNSALSEYLGEVLYCRIKSQTKINSCRRVMHHIQQFSAAERICLSWDVADRLPAALPATTRTIDLFLWHDLTALFWDQLLYRTQRVLAFTKMKGAARGLALPFEAE